MVPRYGRHHTRSAAQAERTRERGERQRGRVERTEPSRSRACADPRAAALRVRARRTSTQGVLPAQPECGSCAGGTTRAGAGPVLDAVR